MKAKTAEYRLRYIVPFAYNDKKKSQAYEYVCDRLLASGRWVNDELQGDSDCYKYLREQYVLKRNGKYNINSIGSIWNYQKEANADKRKALVSVKYESEQQTIIAGIVDAGLYLLKNGVGLFWYEAEFKDGKAKNSEIAMDTLIPFQYEFKELASRSECKYKLYYEGRKEVRLEEIEHYEMTAGGDEEAFVCEYKGKTYQIPPSVIAQIANTNDIEQIQLKRLPHNDISVFHMQYQIVAKTPLGVWINGMLSDLDCNVQYYPEVESKSRNCTMPDKAILYQYVVADITKDERENLAYCLTNGYKDSYKVDASTKERMRCAFDNITWYAEKEGCGIYANYTEDNKTFLTENMQQRAMGDYFFLYMNLLQQSYVLLNVSEEIATTISADREAYIVGKPRNGKLLEGIQMKIDIFLVKNMHASVSHIGHHNLFYEYVEERLRIRNDIASMREGLEALEEIHRRQEDNKLTIGLAVLSVFGIVSVFKDMKETLDIFEKIGTYGAHVWIAFGIALVISVLVLFVLRDSLFKLFVFTASELKNIFRNIRKR